MNYTPQNTFPFAPDCSSLMTLKSTEKVIFFFHILPLERYSYIKIFVTYGP